MLSEEANQLVNNNQINMQTYFIQLACRWFTIQQFYGGSMKVLSVGWFIGCASIHTKNLLFTPFLHRFEREWKKRNNKRVLVSWFRFFNEMENSHSVEMFAEIVTTGAIVRRLIWKQIKLSHCFEPTLLKIYCVCQFGIGQRQSNVTEM